MTTPYWSDFVPNSTYYRILSGFHRTFATGVACRQGTLTPPDTWSRPFGTCICSICWDQSFSELVVLFPDYALRISLGTFSILLTTKFVFNGANENQDGRLAPGWMEMKYFKLLCNRWAEFDKILLSKLDSEQVLVLKRLKGCFKVVYKVKIAVLVSGWLKLVQLWLFPWNCWMEFN